MNVVNLDAYRKQRESQKGNTIRTSVPCGTCSELLYLTTHITKNEPDEKILVCVGCTMMLSLGTENEGY